MDTTWMAKQMIDFQKTAFDNTYQATVMLQDHMEKVTNTMIEQAAWVPEESRRLGNQWIETCKKGRDELKTIADNNFNKLSEML
jgi:polyhydroxyalkanoate synthesis regulator phasin